MHNNSQHRNKIKQKKIDIIYIILGYSGEKRSERSK